MPNILIVDCFDSFTYNLYHYLDELNNGSVSVQRYDEFNVELARAFSHVVFSPGPGLPEDYPLVLEYIDSVPEGQSILGVCLGHQSIGLAFGAKMKQLNRVKHGQQLRVNQRNTSILFAEIESEFESGHYHSWVLDENDFPIDKLKITSQTKDRLIMSVEHKFLPIYGIQFHPESVMTPAGKTMIKNWLLKGC